MKTTTGKSTQAALLGILGMALIALYCGKAIAQMAPLNIDKNGNVGIGTTTPKCILEIRKDSSRALGPILLLQNNGGGAGAGCAIDFNGHDVQGNAATFRIQSVDDGSFSSHMVFYSKKPGNVTNALEERMRITAGGTVDIGNPVPQATLAVKGRIKDATGWVMPVGTIVAYGGSIAPEGWLLCDGKTDLSPAQFEPLRKVLGGFKVPNLQGRFIVGTGSGQQTMYALGNTGGEERHTLTESEMPSHTHGYDASETSESNQGWVGDPDKGARRIKISDRGGQVRKTTAIQNAGGGQSHENRPPYYALTYIIKY